MGMFFLYIFSKNVFFFSSTKGFLGDKLLKEQETMITVSEVVFLENLYFPEYINILKCDVSFIYVYECRNTARKGIENLSFEHKTNQDLKDILRR